MRWGDGMRLCGLALLERPLRSLLSLLGVAIGIATVVVLGAIGEGLRVRVLEGFSQFGTRVVTIRPGKTQTGGLGGLLASTRPLSIADAESLRRLPHVQAVLPIIHGNGDIEAPGHARRVDIYGTGADLVVAWQVRMALGEFLPPARDGRSPPNVVLGHRLSRELFGTANPLGRRVRVDGMRFRVIGVLGRKGNLLGFDLDDIAYIPVDWAEQMFNREGLVKAQVLFDEDIQAPAFVEQVRQALLERHGQEDFSLTAQNVLLSSLNRMLAALTLGVATLGGISLLVGAVGILTIMATAVSERTAEIGLLRSLGGSPGQVLGLFLGEATLLSLAGGLLGVTLSALLLVGLHLALPALPLAFRPALALAALILAALVGILAGLAPARRAARLQPMDALRCE
ncbi:ABC transporter permease [Pseudomonas jinjuensis]|uniref:Putative ABC transport system permease protein n=1 Tax=Pseudomonas jinjuensis TaxID=198616 RepID=A0A1G9ZEC2_9PSED|nr:ABC transporter permease [Pseudomonas jinjuensis]SDN19574.1 putative ABC transport system permease protein [Pseudomonas jinjuensis]